jgi:hypothetical protein
MRSEDPLSLLCVIDAKEGFVKYDTNRVAKGSAVAQVRSALVFSRSAALAEYGGFPDLHYYIMDGRHPSALQLLSDSDTRSAVGEGLANFAAECDRSAEPAKRSAGRKLRASRIGLLSAFSPALRGREQTNF